MVVQSPYIVGWWMHQTEHAQTWSAMASSCCPSPLRILHAAAEQFTHSSLYTLAPAASQSIRPAGEGRAGEGQDG